MNVLKTKRIAYLLEEAANIKIELAEVIMERELSTEERDNLYFADIKDKLGLVFKHCPDIKPLALSNALQAEEMFSSKNIYFTVKDNHLERDPNEEEIREHYINKRAGRFRTNFDAIMAAKTDEKKL